jgi:hypothetical protein
VAGRCRRPISVMAFTITDGKIVAIDILTDPSASAGST